MNRTHTLLNRKTRISFGYLGGAIALVGVVLPALTHAENTQEYIVEKKQSCDLVQTADALGEDSEPLTESMLVTTSDKRTLSEIKANPCVVSVGKNSTVSIADTPNDPNFDEQWTLENRGQTVLQEKGTRDVDIGYTDVFDTISNVQTKTNVAVVDTGVSRINELKGRLTNGKDVIDEDNNPADENGHGTFISSLIAANTNNNKQIAGINENVNIMPIRVLDEKGVGKVSHLIKGIDYAIQNDADIINLSLVSKYSEQVTSVIKKAHENGILVVAAAGNEGVEIANSNLRTPLANENAKDWIVGVSAHDNAGNRIESSNYGEHVDSIAPGKHILGVNQNGTLQYQTGTSIATANVTGVLSVWDALYDNITPQRAFDLVRAYTDDNRLNVSQVIQRLKYPNGTLIRSNNSGVFLLENGKKRPITHPSIFLSHNYQWENIVVVNQAQLDIYETGESLKLRDGSLVADTERVYAVENGVLRPIKNADLFQKIGYQWENVRQIPEDVLDDHAQGAMLDNPNDVPDGTVVYSDTSSGVFLIENDKKRPFYNPDIFLNRYQWKDTVKISDSKLESFEEGEPILPRSGSLLADENRVYVIDGQTKRPVSSAQVFLERGYNWMNVRTVTQGTLNLLETGSVIK